MTHGRIHLPHPAARPEDAQVRILYHGAFGFSDDLPDLMALRPEANTRPEGLADCYCRLKQEGRLPATS